MADEGLQAGGLDRRTVLGLAAGTGAALAGCVDLGADPALEVPDSARIDEPVGVVATGLPADTEVRVDASTTNPRTGEEWTASATVRTDADGRVDLRDATPVDGAYESRDGMGLFWSMQPDAPSQEAWFPVATHDVSLAVRTTDAPTQAAGSTTDPAESETTDSAESATTDSTDDALATATTTRRLPVPDAEPLDDGLVGTVHYPDGDDPAPAVVALHGSGGVEPIQTARLLATHGYVAASVQYFRDPDPLPDSLAEVPIEYVGEVVRRLRADDRVAAAPIGLQGASKGGELALLAGAHVDDVGAVVSVSGSGVVWEGLTESSRAADASSWTIDDDPVPYVEMPESYPGSVRAYYERGLDEADANTRADATVPVERVDGPVALVTGRDDGIWNGGRLQRIAADRRRDADAPVTHERYDDAGHSIRPPLQPTYGRSAGSRYEFGGTPAGNARAARSSWQLTLETFERGLRN